jgi:hypothetical protein
MYKGTLIRDLMAMVERAELRAEQQHLAAEQELRMIFAMQIPLAQGDRVYVGAA